MSYFVRRDLAKIADTSAVIVIPNRIVPRRSTYPQHGSRIAVDQRCGTHLGYDERATPEHCRYGDL